MLMLLLFRFFFFKQKTAYEMRINDWSSDVCSSDLITEATCEHCNTYNMLKLTRQLWTWEPDGALFDYYERAHLNHVMAAQNPATGGFTYMTPLLSGTERGYSTTRSEESRGGKETVRT